jgi:hypothetical protein
MKGETRFKALFSARGTTLAELIVAIGIFLVIMQVMNLAFRRILAQVGQQQKSLESYTGNIVPLEQLRADLQGAGFGLPFGFQSTPSPARYSEITAGDASMPVSAGFWPSGAGPGSFNDAPGNAPRAVQSSTTCFNRDSDGLGSQYLVIKSLSVAHGETQRKWLNVVYSDSGRSESLWGSAARDFNRSDEATERVLVMKSTFGEQGHFRQLQVKNGEYSCLFRQYTTLTTPHSAGDVFQIYGIDPAVAPRMPFNRADYYVSPPSSPSPSCAPNTGTLYKAVAGQGAGSGYTEMPLLHCVADLQVAYGIGPPGAPGAQLYRSTLPGAGSAREIREQLKEIRVYILSHEGKRDPDYLYPAATINVGEEIGGTFVGRRFDLQSLIGGNWRNYRWKLYTIVVRPNNLIQ